MTRSLVIYAALVLFAAFATAHLSAATSEEISFLHVPGNAWTGEPYALIGNKVIFANWYFVRPGGYAWVNEAGQGVTANRSVSMGPWGASYRRSDDSPRGIRLVVEKPQRFGPVLTREKPWELGSNIRIRTVIKEDNRYRAWVDLEQMVWSS